MEVSVESLNPQLKAARNYGEELAEFIALFVYFIKHTPEGRAVCAQIEQDWRQTCDRLREEKRLVGADFSMERWLDQVRKDLLSDKCSFKPVKKTKSKATRQAKRKPLRFRGIDT